MIIIKVIYFDEGSATDFLSILNDGELIKELIEYDENKKKNSKNIDTEGDINIGLGISKIFSMFKGNLNGSVSLGYNYENITQNSNFIKTTISNTILTDFISYTKISDEKENDPIVKFSNYDISIPPNSIAMFQQITPYMLMIDNEVSIDDTINLRPDKIYEVLEFVKGYYELIGSKKNDKKVFRFNNNSFRNNYSISDLAYMDLVFYGIKSGKIKESYLDLNKLFDKAISKDISKDNLSDEMIQELYKNDEEKFIKKDEDCNTDIEYEMYDIILAGVASE